MYYIKVLTEDEESTGKYKRIYSISYSFNNYVKSITVTGNKTVSVNKTIRLKAIVKPDNATAKEEYIFSPMERIYFIISKMP